MLFLLFILQYYCLVGHHQWNTLRCQGTDHSQHSRQWPTWPVASCSPSSERMPTYVQTRTSPKHCKVYGIMYTTRQPSVTSNGHGESYRPGKFAQLSDRARTVLYHRTESKTTYTARCRWWFALSSLWLSVGCCAYGSEGLNYFAYFSIWCKDIRVPKVLYGAWWDQGFW